MSEFPNIIKAAKSTSNIEMICDIPFPDFDEIIPLSEKTRKRFLSAPFLTSNGNSNSSSRLSLENENSSNNNSTTNTNNESPIPTLPEKDIIPRITPETLVDVINGKYKESFDKVIVLDCRFKYEYDGGHIMGAINVDSEETLKKLFFNDSLKKKTTCFVFHCEFSHNRGPQLSKIFREIDRQINYENYPELTYPYIYVLDGGYRNFYSQYLNTEYCDGGYVRMYNKTNRHDGSLAKSLSKFRNSFESSRRRSSNDQAQTLPKQKYHPTFC